MHQGRVVEAGTREAIIGDPRHPYLKALLDAVPRFGLPPDARLQPIRDIASGNPMAVTSAIAMDDGAGPRRTNVDGTILDLRDLKKVYSRRKTAFALRAGPGGDRAVDGVSLAINAGECLGLVGESGSGKTTLAKLIVRATTADAGTITYYDESGPVDVLALEGQDLAAYRRAVQYIFQDPYGALDPRMTVQEIVTEPLTIQGIGTRAERLAAARDLLGHVGLDDRYLNRYPHSFSGGQRQRIGIARALALRPRLLICDEPVSALDVGIQAQILNLLKDLQGALGLTYLFVTHNLAVVNYIADRIAVMCRGRIVELAPRAALFDRPTHPYTQSLLAAIPDVSLERNLDFEALPDETAARPDAWPQPYRRDDATPQTLHDIGGGHYVLAAASAAPRELVA
jgi:peptide/nickel transport system ATP-binding protein